MLDTFIFPAKLPFVARTSSTMLNRSGNNRYFCFVSDLRGKSIQSFTLCYDVSCGVFLDAFIGLRGGLCCSQYGWLLVVAVQLLSHIQLFETPWTAARQASLSITSSQSLPKLMSMKLRMPSKHLILCHPLFLLPSVLHSIRVSSNGSALRIRWSKYWSFSFSSVLPINIQDRLLLGLTDLLSLHSTISNILFTSVLNRWISTFVMSL